MRINKIKNLSAFTLAEVLITLSIIGVVAAITVPSVIINHQKKSYVAQLKKAYSGLSKGFRMAMARDGVTRLEDTVLWAKINDSSVGYNRMTNNHAFFDEFQKYFNITRVYDGSANSVLNGDGIQYYYLRKDRKWDKYKYGIVFADGTILYPQFSKTPNISNLSINNKSNFTSLQEIRQYAPNLPIKLWQRVGYVWVDVNGVKGPNVLGRDFFGFTVGNDGNLYPFGGYEESTQDRCFSYWESSSGLGYYWSACFFDSMDAYEEYKEDPSLFEDCDPDKETGGTGCTGRIIRESWKMNY